MDEKEIKITSNTPIEQLIEKIALGELQLEGRGYINKNSGVVGLMIYVKDSPSEIIDIYYENYLESDGKLLKIGG